MVEKNFKDEATEKGERARLICYCFFSPVWFMFLNGC
ncbi:hypothetical protein POPTR_009G159650v4 [Populus trichocarpa]|uniref:Uncharacterized protein n=1 Tax=Populus trichocarpa TaxID=3694 RepID=A0ACC0SIQ5_POPTR|nr:hypothetical protein POPTR_009G159650v4 [Populus trichocarpa]